jgi:hypothetical protein
MKDRLQHDRQAMIASLIAGPFAASPSGHTCSTKQQYDQDNQNDEPKTAAAIAEMGRHIARVAAEERKHDEDEDDYKKNS